MRGQQTTGSETATEYMGMRSAGELRSDTYNLMLATMSIEDIVRDMVDYKRQYMTSPSNFYYWPEKKTYSASPEDYDGNFSYQAFASFKHQKELERRHYIEAMQIVSQNPMFVPYVMPTANEWLERLLGYFDLRSPDQLRLDPMEQQMAQQQAMLTQAMGMMGGGEGMAMGEKAKTM